MSFLTNLFKNTPSKIASSKRSTVSNLSDTGVMPYLIRKTSLDSDVTIQEYDEKEKSFQYLRKVLTPRMFDYYIDFLESLKPKYKESLYKPSSQRTITDEKNIHKIFDMIEPIDTPLLVYRCYQNGVNFHTLTTQKNNTVLSSTTLSFKYANQWCENIVQPGVIYDFQTPIKSNFIICILILPGTKIIPLIADYLENKRRQYEILLDSRSTLHFTGEIKQPQGIPIFVSLPGNDISVNNEIYERNKIMIREIIEKEKKDRLDEIYRDPERTDDVDHFMKWQDKYMEEEERTRVAREGEKEKDYKNPDLWSGDEDYFMKKQDKDMEGGKSRKLKKTRKSRKLKKTRKY